MSIRAKIDRVKITCECGWWVEYIAADREPADWLDEVSEHMGTAHGRGEMKIRLTKMLHVVLKPERKS